MTSVILRKFIPEDAEAVSLLAGERLVALSTGSLPHPYTQAMATEWLKEHENYWEAGTQYIFAITHAERKYLLGCVSLTVDLKQPHRAELGYWVGKPYWGNGFATAAGKSLLVWGFENLPVEKIFARHFGMNPASGRVLQKLGFKTEGVLREHFVRWGVPHDLHHYGMLRSEWTERVS